MSMDMERRIGVESARGELGRLVEEVGRGGEPILFSKRGQALAVLVSREEYARLKQAATQLIRAELQDRLARVRQRVEEAGLEPGLVDEAVEAARAIE